MVLVGELKFCKVIWPKTKVGMVYNGGGFPIQTGKYYQASNGEQLRPM